MSKWYTFEVKHDPKHSADFIGVLFESDSPNPPECNWDDNARQIESWGDWTEESVEKVIQRFFKQHGAALLMKGHYILIYLGHEIQEDLRKASGDASH